MKHVWIWVLLLFCPGPAPAQSGIADEQANCNASFQGGCPADPTVTTSSDGFAAPVGTLGSSGLEAVLVALLIAAGISRRLHGHLAEGGRKSAPSGIVDHPEFGGQSSAQQELLGADRFD